MTTRARRTPTEELVTILVVATVYFLAGTLGLRFASIHASASPVWPPTGVAIAAFLLVGRRVAPAIFAGAFLFNLATAGNVATSLAIGAGNTLEGLVGAYLVARFAGGVRAFEAVPSVLRFAAACMAAPVVSATVGVTSLAIAGFAEWRLYGPIWTTWWIGDVGGALIVAPFLLALSDARYRPKGARQYGETLALAVVAGAAAALVFLPTRPVLGQLAVSLVPLL
ncbi:MAG: MASE1 domain-containing protein, partial [Methanobacteriota archaeon]